MSITPTDPMFNPCADYKIYLVKTYISNAVSSLLILIINEVLNYILKKLSEFQKYQNETSEAGSKVIKGVIATYFNTTFVVLVSSWDFSGFQPSKIVVSVLEQWKIVNSGSTDKIITYADFYRSWYLDTGLKIISLVIISIFSPHLINLVSLPFFKCWRRRKISRAKL